MRNGHKETASFNKNMYAQVNVHERTQALRMILVSFQVDQTKRNIHFPHMTILDHPGLPSKSTHASLLSLAECPRYIMQQAMYLPWRGSHFTIMEAGSKTDMVISATDSCSWYAFSAEITGA